jgi:hypothetical protein
MDAFRGIADDLKARLLRWIAEVEEGHRPEILDAPERYSRQYRLKASDLMGSKNLERPIEAPTIGSHNPSGT